MKIFTILIISPTKATGCDEIDPKILEPVQNIYTSLLTTYLWKLGNYKLSIITSV